MVIFKTEETTLIFTFIINLNGGLKKENNPNKHVFSLVSLKFQEYFVTAGTFKKTLKMYF